MKSTKKNRYTILIVDDNILNIDILFELLSDYDVIPTLSGKDAIDILAEENIDLILLDILMPELNGFETCKLIKQNPKTSHIPIFMLTSQHSTDDIKKGFDLGIVDYVTKPFNPTELLVRINNHIELSSYRLYLEEKINQEIKKVQEANSIMLQQSRLAEMGELINMIAHQWRQPLGAINSSMIAIDFNIQSGQYDLSNTKQQEKFLNFINDKHKKISSSVEFLSNTIDDFRNFYKMDKEKELIDIQLPVIKILDIIESLMNKNKIKIIQNFSTNDKVYMYQNELMQVILNILKNSEDNFICNNIQNPTIEITITKDDNQHIISISDNGGGIDNDIIDDIFNPYFSTKENKNGTGLGLYMSKTIIEIHHKGTLSVKNILNGVCFKIVL